MFEIFTYDGSSLKKVDSLSDIGNDLCWVDSTNITKEEEKLLGDHFNLHPITTEDLYTNNVRIKIEEFNDYLFCVLYGIEKSGDIKLHEIDYVLGKNFFITNHKKQISSINDLKKDPAKISSLFKLGLDFLFHAIVDAEVDNFFPVLEFADVQIEHLEEEITNKIQKNTMAKILDLKREIVRIKRITLPQRDKISILAKNSHPLISKKAVIYFRDVYDHAVRVSDSIDTYRESVAGVFDAYMSAVSNNMNEVMKVLSIIATIALPLSVISGIYGTNFTNLPGASFQYGFWVMIGLMALMMIGMLTYFKRKEWI